MPEGSKREGTETVTLLEAAVGYARRGWKVHPLKPRSKNPNSQHGSLDATSDVELIRDWWERHPNDNIGLATGYGFFVLDIDTKASGHLWLESVDLPPTISQRTGSGGTHFLFAGPPTVPNSSSKIAPGVDIRGKGGYIVAPPSIHPNGDIYRWIDCDTDIPLDEPAAAPEWLLNAAGTVKEHYVPPVDGIIPHPRQHETLWKYTCSVWGGKTKFTEDEVLAMVLTLSKRCEEVPPEENVRKIVYSVTRKHPQGLSPEYAARLNASSDAPPPPETDGLDVIDEAIKSGDPKRVMGVASILATLPESDYELFRLTIKEVYGNRLSVASLDRAVFAHRPSAASSENSTAAAILEKNQILNDTGNLYRYNQTHWYLVQDEAIKQLALHEEGPEKSTSKSRNEILDFIRSTTYCQNHAWRRLTSSEIPVGNGVLDLNTMELRPHRPEDYLKSSIPWGYNPKAQCPQLMRCLDTYFGKDDDCDSKINALQEFFGYCLMPHARYKKALLCYGESDCGKSTIPYLLRVLLGHENVTAVGVEHMDDPRKRAPLLGKLVNLLTEITSDAMIADGGFKTLVSTEEPILFDPKHVTPIMEVPICKHVIVTNNLPKVSDRSEGTYNRLLLIHFQHIIPKNKQDTQVWDRLRLEVEGILSWSIEGAIRLLEKGGKFTDPGIAEVAEYKKDQNPIHGFIEDKCERDESYSVHMPEFVDRFRNHSGGRWTPQQVAAVLRSAGYEVTKNAIWINGTRARAVIGLKFR